jgi:DivIVA domain-containing protein
MPVLVVVVVAALLIGVGVLVALRGGGDVAEAPPESPYWRLPDDGPLMPADLDAVRFSTTVRGYRMAEVDEVLDRFARELRRRDAEVARLRAAAVLAAEPAETRRAEAAAQAGIVEPPAATDLSEPEAGPFGSGATPLGPSLPGSLR